MSMQIENKPGLWRAGRLSVSRAGARTALVVAMALGAIAVQAPQALASDGKAPRVTPSIKLSPRAGPPTQAVTVSGGGFGASERVDVYFDTTDEALASTNASGHFSGITLRV